MKSLSVKVRHIEESQTLALAARAKSLKAAGVDVVDLTTGEPDFPTPAHIKEAAIRAIRENFTRYTPNQGIPDLLKAITGKFEGENNLNFTPAEILVSCGAKHSIFNAMQALCNPADEVVIPAPYWLSYPEMVKLVDARSVIIRTTIGNNFKITPQQLRKAINDRTKLLIFNSPSNPTGSVYSQGEIEELAEVIRQTGIYVISDEIYEKVIYDGKKHFSIGSIKAIRDQVITVNGVSKAFAMTGWRIGYLGARKEIVEAASKVQSQTTSNANSIAQRAALEALTGSNEEVIAMVGEFELRRNFVLDQLKQSSGVQTYKPHGSFLVLPCLENLVGRLHDGKVLKDDVAIAQYLLEEKNVAVVPGHVFGAPNHIRLSYACSMEELKKGMDRMREAFRELMGG